MSSELFNGINRIKNPSDPSDLEKKHVPTIEAPDEVEAWQPFTVNITVGNALKHPDEGAHFIQWVELYAGEAFLARVDFTPTVCTYPVSLTVKLGEDVELRALARCNLHGVWEGTKPLKVKKSG